MDSGNPGEAAPGSRTKAAWRARLLAERDAVPTASATRAAEALARRAAEAVPGNATVCCYVPFGSEPGSLAMLDALRDTGAEVRRVLLIGGAARSEAVQAIAPGLFGVDVDIPEPAEYVAIGAAKQAAWARSGNAEPPEWEVAGTRRTVGDDTSGAAVRAAYAAAREQVHGI